MSFYLWSFLFLLLLHLFYFYLFLFLETHIGTKISEVTWQTVHEYIVQQDAFCSKNSYQCSLLMNNMHHQSDVFQAAVLFAVVPQKWFMSSATPDMFWYPLNGTDTQVNAPIWSSSNIFSNIVEVKTTWNKNT